MNDVGQRAETNTHFNPESQHCIALKFCRTDVVLVAEVNSLEGLPHDAFQLTLRYPRKDRKKPINGLVNCDSRRCSQKKKSFNCQCTLFNV